MKYRIMRFLRKLGWIRHSRGTYWLDWSRDYNDFLHHDHVYSGVQHHMKRILLFGFIRLKTTEDVLWRYGWVFPEVEFVVYREDRPS